MANRQQVWVSPSDHWRRVHKSWAQRDIQTFNKKEDAVSKARDVAKNQDLELKIQRRDWAIHWWNSYGGDPFPPRDRK